jgi:hypothetical protein
MYGPRSVLNISVARADMGIVSIDVIQQGTLQGDTPVGLIRGSSIILYDLCSRCWCE